MDDDAGARAIARTDDSGASAPYLEPVAPVPMLPAPPVAHPPPADSSASSSTSAAAAPPAWSAWQRFGFRFLFAYLVLYIFPFPINYLPGIGPVLTPYVKAVDALAGWVGRVVFHVKVEDLVTGSGDSAYSYVVAFCWLVLASVVAVVWTLLAGRRREHARLLAWLRVLVRFSLATTLITYGAVKVIQSQFPAPSLDRLVQPFGDASPMGLLWTFMGASRAYNVFAGASEMLGGILLTLRRTTLLGALVSFAVLLNVVMLNFCYDVPVKLYSLHLLAMAAFLAAPDLRRLADFFVLDRQPAPAPVRPLFARPWLHHGTRGLRTLAILAYVAWAIHGAEQTVKMYGGEAPKPPFYGIWNVDELSLDGQLRPPLVTDTDRWRRLIFSYPQSVAVQTMNDSRQRYALKLDAAKGTMVLSERKAPGTLYPFVFRRPGPDLLVVDGTLKGHRLHAALHRVKTSSFELVSRGFHWVSEYPYNR